MMKAISSRGKITKSIILLCAVLACVLLIRTLGPVGDSKAKLSEILLAQPVFAQQATAFPSDEAGISACVNVGQTIDLTKAKSAFRGIQAEGSNYIIGIVELAGLPEEEFPHMYVSSDGWILAYYSKFAPASRIMQWYGYEGETITTTTLQDAIAKICPTIGVNFAQARENMSYYHFKYPEATKIVIVVDTTDTDGEDSFNFSIPWGVTLYEASWSHYASLSWSYSCGDYSILQIDGVEVNDFRTHSNERTFFQFNYVTEDSYLVPDKPHTVSIKFRKCSYAGACTGTAIVFIYR